MAQFATFVKNNQIHASKMEAKNLTHIGFGNYKKATGEGPTFVWDPKINDFVEKTKEHTKLLPTATRMPLGFRPQIEIHDPKFLRSKPVPGPRNHPTYIDAMKHAQKHIDDIIKSGKLGDYLNEGVEDLKRSKAVAKGLEHIAFNLYKNKSNKHFKWDKKSSDFVEIKDRHPYDLTPKSKEEHVKDLSKFVDKLEDGEWHGFDHKHKQTKNAVEALVKAGKIEVNGFNQFRKIIKSSKLKAEATWGKITLKAGDKFEFEEPVEIHKDGKTSISSKKSIMKFIDSDDSWVYLDEIDTDGKLSGRMIKYPIRDFKEATIKKLNK